MKKLLLILSFLTIPCSALEERWNWAHINTQDLHFPQPFNWGVALSEYQNSGAVHCPNSNWAEWEMGTDTQGKPRIDGGQKSGKACNFYENWREDINLLKELGINSLRLSVEWSLIEPQSGIFDEKVIAHYREICEALLAAHITPLITLHHFTDPLWFSQLGGFEKEENIFYFARFSEHIFKALADIVPLWVTINEPGIYTFQGYLLGVFPPGQRWNFKLASIVLKNLMKAHIEVYKVLKATELGQKVQIGLVHQIVQFEQFHEYNILERTVAKYMNSFMHGIIFKFLKTGKFRFDVPFTCHTKYKDSTAPDCYDFIGLNYYSNFLVMCRWPDIIKAGSGYREPEIATDMPYGEIYAEGLYRAIKMVSELGVPIYITECGIADKKDDRRKLFLERYLYATSCALEDGYDVRGFYYWSLMDNFEWNMGYDMKFGLYEVDFETQKRTLRQGAYPFIETIRRFKKV
jgi:beta-glucosidase